jgi:hypothetical protein
LFKEKKPQLASISTRKQKIRPTFYNILQHFRTFCNILGWMIVLKKKPQLASSPQGNKIYHLDDLPVVKKNL